MNNIFYVYVYCNKKFLYKVKNDYGIKFLPIYVGKGKDKRIESHSKKSHNRVLRKYIKKMKSENNDPLIIKIKDNMEENDAYKLENEIIKNVGVIYSGKGCLFNKYIDGSIYEIYESDIIKEIIEKYEEMVTSDINENISLNPTFICYNTTPQEKDDSKKVLAKSVGIPPIIKIKIMEYMKIGFTIKQCSDITKISCKQILEEVDEEFIEKWTI